MSNRRHPRNRRILQAAVLSLSVLGVLYGLLVRPQWVQLEAERKESSDLGMEVARTRGKAERAEAARQDMISASNTLAKIESSMAAGDVYLWSVKMFERFQSGHDIHFSEIDRPELGETDLLPRVPYQTARLTVSGRATYHQFGAFLSDFENAFPFARLDNLELAAPGSNRGNPDESEQLRFRMGVSILVRVASPVMQ